MMTQSTTRSLRRLLFVAAMMIIVDVLMAPTAFARIRANTNDVISVSLDRNRGLIVEGHTNCDPKETILIRVTVTQRSTGAVAEGDVLLTATGEIQEWVIRAPILGRQRFEEGPVTVVYLIHTSYRGDSTDSNQWLRSDLSIKRE